MRVTLTRFRIDRLVLMKPEEPIVRYVTLSVAFQNNPSTYCETLCCLSPPITGTRVWAIVRGPYHGGGQDGKSKGDNERKGTGTP